MQVEVASGQGLSWLLFNCWNLLDHEAVAAI